MRTLEQLGISPVPWEAAYLNRDFSDVHAADGTLVSCVENPASEEIKADARLIAAAPELYKALEECERKLDACDPYCNLLKRVRAALAKASGESEETEC